MDPIAHPEQPKLAAVELENFPGLEGCIRFELDDTRTVLVGKNGAGKSLVVEALARIPWFAKFLEPGMQTTRFRCEVARPGLPALAYEYRKGIVERVERGLVSDVSEWFERCWELGGEEVWRVEDSSLYIRGELAMPLPPFSGLLDLGERPFTKVSEQARLIYRMFAGIYLAPAGLPRGGEGEPRHPVLLPRPSAHSNPSPPTQPLGRLAKLVLWILQQQATSTQYEEFVDILRVLGVAREIAVETYTGRSTNSPDFAAVLLDGVNLGLHADGTLRVVEIVAQMLQKDITCLLVEEPESGLHPGMLARLLDMMTSYSLDRQIIVTTHSPQVVNWVAPSQVRIVERRDGSTHIGSIAESQLPRVARYLADEGTLADFLYGFESD